MITVSGKYAPSVLQGKGLTLDEANATLLRAITEGMYVALVGDKQVPVTFENNMFSIGIKR